MRTFALVGLLLATACSAPRYSPRTRPLPPPPPVPVQAPPELVAPIDEAATNAWLETEIERAPRIEPPEPIVQFVERPVYVYDRSSRHYDPYYGHYRRRSTFPINTAIGAGIGAIIGHQDGHRGRGAWIGGSIGYLLDTARW